MVTFEWNSVRAREVAREEGHEDGFAEGFVKGFQEGFGEKIGKATPEISEKMMTQITLFLLKEKLLLETITNVTHLSKEEVEKIAEEHHIVVQTNYLGKRW